MKRTGLILSLFALLATACQQKETTPEMKPKAPVADDLHKVVLVTLDGVRWQEVFTGIDSVLMVNHDYVKDTEVLQKEFWHSNPLQRRETLMPFLWSTVEEKGQIYGNRAYGNMMNVELY